MMEYPKFILTGEGHLRLGMVTLHRHLLEPGDTCLGGGYYEIDYRGGVLVLDGASSDYGKPLWHCVDEITLPAMCYGLAVVYRYSDGEEYVLAEHHKISYD